MSYAQRDSSYLFKFNTKPKKFFYNPGLPAERSNEIYDRFYLIQSANAGQPDAQHIVGLRYLTGQGFPADTAMSLYWIEKAASQGHLQANYNLGIFLINGWGNIWNPFLAYRSFYYAAENGMPLAQYVIGIIHTDNLIVKQDYYKAYSWLKKAKQGGIEDADEVIEKLESLGINSEIDISTATAIKEPEDNSLSPKIIPVYINFDEDTTREISPFTLIQDFNTYATSKEVINFKINNEDEIGENITKLAELVNYGSGEAALLMAIRYENGGEKFLAAEYYMRAFRNEAPKSTYFLNKMIKDERFFPMIESGAFNGNSSAQYVWACLTALDIKFKTTDDDAFTLWNRAAKNNHIPSLIELGQAYYSGNGVERDRDKAFAFWNLAASLDSKDASIRIALAVVRDMPESPAVIEAIKILIQAADYGSNFGSFGLGYVYENGIGVNFSLPSAVKYYREAAQRGSRIALRSLSRIYDSIRPDDPEFTLK